MVAATHLSKINHQIHTDAVKEMPVPVQVTKEQANAIYAGETDLLNVTLFGKKQHNGERKGNKQVKGSIRGEAASEQLVILANLEASTRYCCVKTCPRLSDWSG